MIRVSFEKTQRDLINAMDAFYEAGGIKEKSRVCRCLPPLRQGVFDLSYEDVHMKAEALEKKCVALGKKYPTL